jgi:endonuclease-3
MQDKDIHPVMRRLQQEVKRWQKPVVGHYARTPFTVLISCLLSLRTRDGTTDTASRRLFGLADDPRKMIALSPETIEKAIYPVGFYRTKAQNIIRICRMLIADFDGRVPQEIDRLLLLPGVGRKTANLVMTLGHGKAGICVDTHVHRITNRWGYVQTRKPEQTEKVLRQKLPRRYWVHINDLLVAYGQNRCKPISPICSRCLIHTYCQRIGVERFR